MHSLLAVDKNSRPLTASILWSDGRSAGIAKRLRDSSQGKSIYQTTGTPLHAMSPLCKLIWLRENEPALFNVAYKFVSIKEWIWFRLFGVWEVDWSIASATGLFNNQLFSWDAQALSLTGILINQLSALVSTTLVRHELRSETATLLNLPVGTAFCIGASDGCLANVGSDALKTNTAALTIGTSAAVRIASPIPIIDAEAMPFSYVLDESTFICGAPVSNGGNVVQWLQQNFLNGECSYDELLQQVATIPPGSDGLLCLPHLHGERAPVWDEASAGAFIGIRPHHTRTNFLRAALEGVCYSLRGIIELLEAQSQPILALHASGGFVQSPIWLQLLTDVVGKRLIVTQTEDASAIGAALWGWKAVQQTVSLTASGNQSTFQPNAATQTVYKQYFDVYRSLYPALKTTFHQLAQLHS